jgi:hypothetical protein
MEEPSPGCGPLGAPSPYDRGLGGVISGRSVDFSLGEVCAATRLRAESEEVGAFLAPTGV